MRTLVRSLQVLGLAVLAALAAGAVVSADSSGLRQAGYGGTGPTGTRTPSPTPTRTATPTASPTPAPGGAPKVKLKLRKGATAAKGVRARVTFNRAGKVRLRATRGRRKVGSRSVKFATPGTRTKRLKLRNLGALPAKVKVRAQGRDASGRRSRIVQRAVKIGR